MHDNTHIQTVAKDFSRSRERKLSISRSLDVLDYKSSQQCDQIMRSNQASIELRQVACEKNSCDCV